jgi:hypothetical protein
MDDIRAHLAHEPREALRQTEIMAPTVQDLDGHPRNDTVGHLPAAVQAGDVLLELRAGKTVQQVDDTVLEASPGQAMHHLQDTQRCFVTWAPWRCR